MDMFDETEENVVLSTYGRKKKRKPDEHARNVAKKARHSGGAPSVACTHNIANVCQAATLSSEEIAYINQILYSTTDKVKQDATLLSYMNIETVTEFCFMVCNTKQRVASFNNGTLATEC